MNEYQPQAEVDDEVRAGVFKKKKENVPLTRCEGLQMLGLQPAVCVAAAASLQIWRAGLHQDGREI